jgi:penicillin-binding protein 1C
MEHLSGVAGAAPILHDLFVHLHERRGTSWYAPPENLVEKPIDPITGKLLANLRPRAILEKFVSGHLPSCEEAQHLDAAGRPRLSPEYREWFASGDNWLVDRAVLGSSAEEERLSLVAPLPGTTYYLDPDLPASSQRLSLKAQGTGPFSWESDSLQCQFEPGGTFAVLLEGRHRLRVRNTTTGAMLETWILVKAL